MTTEELVEYINSAEELQLVVELVPNTSPGCILVPAKDLLALMSFLHSDANLYFDSLSSITGIDNGVESNQMEVVYSLYSIPNDLHLMVKVILNREKPVVASLCSIWKAADWHERETYDLLGIHFKGHPDLRRILLPADWEGHPLRKDYEEQTYYRGVKVKY